MAGPKQISRHAAGQGFRGPQATSSESLLPAARQDSQPQPGEHRPTPATVPSVDEITRMFHDLNDKFDENTRAINSMLSLCLEKNHADLVAEMRKFHAETFDMQLVQQPLEHKNQEKHIGLVLPHAEQDMPETSSVDEITFDKQHSESAMPGYTKAFSHSRSRESEWISRRMEIVSTRLRKPSRSQQRLSVASNARLNAWFNWFNNFWYVLIVVSTVLSGFSADMGMSAAMSGQPEPKWINIAELTLSCLFMLELSIRIGVLRCEYFCGDDGYWNTFDALLIVSTLVGDIIDVYDWVRIDVHDWVRIIRGVRIIRLFRVIKGSSTLLQLRLMISCMVNCMSSVLWATLVVLLMMYSSAILFMNAAEVSVKKGDAPIQTRQALQQYYADLPTTMISLFMAVSGGADWGEIQKPVAAIHWSLGCCFMLYIFFAIFGFFNILTGVFVDRAFDSGQMDKDLVLRAETERTETFMKDVKQMFLEMDSDGLGEITKHQFLACQDDSRMMAYMQMHQLNMIEPNFFFQMLDRDGDGMVNLEELIIGMMQFGGQARSSDLMMLIMLIKTLREEVKRFSHDTHNGLSHAGERRLTQFKATV